MGKEAPNGRLVSVGDGRLYMQMFDDEGGTVAVHDDEGSLHPELLEVKYDPAADRFVEVKKGDPSHNADHHRQFVTINGTHGDLYDDKGVLVVPADPHHYEPSPTDPHYAPDAHHKTRVQVLTDDVAESVTGHTAVRS